MSWLGIFVFGRISRSLAIGVLLAGCCYFQGCARQASYQMNVNVNANSSASANAAVANVNAKPYENPSPSQTPALTREEYEKDTSHSGEVARETNRQIGSGSADGWIWVLAYQAVNTNPELSGSKINITVDKGVVTLTGSVRTQKQKVEAVDTIQKLEGVQKVNDQLRVQSVPVSTQNFDIDRELKKLKEGAAITEVPTAMELGEIRRVVLTLSPDPAEAPKIVAEQEEKVKQSPNSAATTKIDSQKIRYSKYMEAKLTAQGFEIKPPPSERQPVTQNQPTVWSWDIKATARGEQYLQLTTNAIFEVPGSEAKVRSVNTFSKVIKVNVSWTTWWNLYWQWVIGVTATVLVGVLTTTWLVSRQR